MHSLAKNNLTRLLQTLSEDELKRFEKFLDSPYYNTIANVRKLYRELRKHAPAFSGESFNRENIWRGLFPGKEFNYGILKNLFHELTILSQKFLVAEETESNIFLNEHILIGQLMSRNVEAMSVKKQKDFWKKFNAENKSQSKEMIQESYHNASAVFWSNTVLNKISRMEIPGKSEYFLGSAYSTISYFMSICKEFNNAIADSSASGIIFEKQVPVVMAKALNSGLMDEILSELKEHSIKDYRVLDTYAAMNKAQMHTGDFGLFKEARSKLIDNAELFPKNDLKDLYNNLSTVLGTLDGSEVNKNEEMLINFDLMSDFGILTDGMGNMGAMYFYYYLVCAFRSLKFNKIGPFSDKYLPITTGDDPDNLKNFESALLAFGKGDFDNALRLISRMKHVSIYIDFFIREFKSCCFYELNEEKYFGREYRALPYLMKSYKSQIPKISTDLKIHFDTVRSLFVLRKEFDPENYRNLSAGLGKSRVWLLKKLKEVKIKS